MRKLIYLLSFLFILNACDGNQDQSSEASEEIETSSTEETAAEETTGTTTKSEEIITDENLKAFGEVSANVADQVLDAYLKIKDALVSTDSDEAKSVAASMHEELQSHEGEAISIIREDIEHIANTQSVEHQREHFKTLSSHVYAMVKSNNASERTLYKQFCPMAFDNTGAYWLSSSEEIRNPYFGDKMLKCGKVQETLNN